MKPSPPAGHSHALSQPGSTPAPTPAPWSPRSWLEKPHAQDIAYADRAQLARVVAQLGALPPLVTSWEVERLRTQIASAAEGKRFILQGGDCAERFDDCTPASIASKLKILLQMSLVLIHALHKPVVRVGRIAGQYAKPRSSATETRTLPDGRTLTLPSYFGDLINHPEFTSEAREPDPQLLLEGYSRAALTLNFVRALTEGGFADLHHPEYWDLSFLRHAALPAGLREEYTRMSQSLASALRFMESLGESAFSDLSRVEFFTSHEGLNLWYESAQTRPVPRREGLYDLSCHMPWIGARTRQLTGAHVEFFRGVRNPVGVKLDHTATPDEVLALAHALNPQREPGKLVFIVRMGAARIEQHLPTLLDAARTHAIPVAWICDPMHANTRTTASGIKTRSVEDILLELTRAIAIHDASGVPLAGVHFELTGEDVTECVGGSGGPQEADLATNYASLCDPRLNYQQSLELAFVLAKRMGR